MNKSTFQEQISQFLCEFICSSFFFQVGGYWFAFDSISKLEGRRKDLYFMFCVTQICFVFKIVLYLFGNWPCIVFIHSYGRHKMEQNNKNCVHGFQFEIK